MKKKFSILIMIIMLFALTGCQTKEQNGKSTEVEENLTEKVDDNSKEKAKELRDVTLDKKELEELEKIIDSLPDDKEEYNKSMDAKDLNNQELLHIGIVTLKNATKEKVENKINDYFGPDIKVKMEDYICPICKVVQLNYDSSKGTFVFSEEHDGHGGSWGWLEKEIIGSQTDGEKYYVKVGKMYFDTSNTTSGYDFSGYKSMEESQNEKNVIIENIYETKYCNSSTEKCDYKKMFMDNIDKINTYTYVFNKDNDNLYFEGYSIDKKVKE